MSTDDSSAADRGSGLSAGLGAWVSCADDLPTYDLPVWLYENGRAYVGCRIFDSDGWLWAKCYSMPYLDKDGTWKMVDAEVDDDYRPTLWQPLPDVPRYSEAELKAAQGEAAATLAALRVE